MQAECECPSCPLYTSSICSCSPAPLTCNSPSTLPLIPLVILSLSFFLWYMNLAFFVAQEMASAETGVLYSGLLPTLKFLSKCVSNERLPLTSWTNYLTTVLLFSAGHQCCDAPHQMACSCYTTVHTEASAACACQQHSACRNQEGLPGIWSCGQSNADAKFDMSKECSGN